MNKKLLSLVGLSLSVLVLTGCAKQAAVQVTGQSTASVTPASDYHDNIYLLKTTQAKGTYLADFAGTSLYTYDKDTVGVSNCTGTCMTAWPVYTSGATSQKAFPNNITVVTRQDGTLQFAWKGMPLYYYAKDANPGDVTGDGVGGVWHLAK